MTALASLQGGRRWFLAQRWPGLLVIWWLLNLEWLRGVQQRWKRMAGKSFSVIVVITTAASLAQTRARNGVAGRGRIGVIASRSITCQSQSNRWRWLRRCWVWSVTAMCGLRLEFPDLTALHHVLTSVWHQAVSSWTRVFVCTHSGSPRWMQRRRSWG